MFSQQNDDVHKEYTHNDVFVHGSDSKVSKFKYFMKILLRRFDSHHFILRRNANTCWIFMHVKQNGNFALLLCISKFIHKYIYKSTTHMHAANTSLTDWLLCVNSCCRRKFVSRGYYFGGMEWRRGWYLQSQSDRWMFGYKYASCALPSIYTWIVWSTKHG